MGGAGWLPWGALLLDASRQQAAKPTILSTRDWTSLSSWATEAKRAVIWPKPGGFSSVRPARPRVFPVAQYARGHLAICRAEAVGVIVSHRWRFVYIGLPKTASTALHHWLSQPAFCERRWPLTGKISIRLSFH